MNLSLPLTGLNKVFVIPIWFEGIDGAPCTVVAELN